METPQLENGYMRIANETMDKLCRFRIPGETRLVLDAIMRKTYGWGKKEDWISNSQIIEMTGLLKGNVSRSLSKLITHKIVIKTDNKLRLNKNLKEWASFNKLSKRITSKKLSKAITGVIKTDTKVIKSEGHNIHYTKDTYTKDILLRNRETHGNTDINSLQEYFIEKMSIPKEDCSQRQSRQYWYLLLKESKKGIEGVRWLIEAASGDEFYKNNITSSKDLYYKRIKIISRKRGSIPTVAVMPKGKYEQ